MYKFMSTIKIVKRPHLTKYLEIFFTWIWRDGYKGFSPNPYSCLIRYILFVFFAPYKLDFYI